MQKLWIASPTLVVFWFVMYILAQLFLCSCRGEGVEGEVLGDALEGHVLLLPRACVGAGGAVHVVEAAHQKTLVE